MLLGTPTPSRRRWWPPQFAWGGSLAQLQDQGNRRSALLARSTAAGTRPVGSLLRERKMRACHQQATPARCVRRSGCSQVVAVQMEMVAGPAETTTTPSRGHAPLQQWSRT